MTYQDACAALGVVLDKRFNHTRHKVQAKSPQTSRRQWSASAAVFMRHCQKQVTIPAIQERHLTPETCLACGIGYNAHDQYPLRVAWGLDNEQLEGGKVRTKLKIPQGIVIATFRHHEIVAFTVRMSGRMTGRTHDLKRKYWQVKGSDNVPFLLGRAHTPLVLLESALDAVLLHQESGVSCAAFMGSTKTPDDSVMQAASLASVVLACPDNDSAGHKAWQRWRALFPNAILWPPLGSGDVLVKDLGEMHALSLHDERVPSLNRWIHAAVQYAQRTQ